ETHARELAERSGRAYVSPYDDEAVIAGQGTIGIEIMDQVAELGWPGVDAIVVATGGGGMISGIATAVAGRARIVGAQPENDAVMTRSVAAGHVVAIDARPTLSDGTAGGVDPDTITFASCRELVDEWITVSEAEIGAGVRHMIDHHSTLVEGASGVALAAAARLVSRRPVARIVVVSCGANISSTTLTRALDLATGPLATGGGQ
ncbi:MAG: pyridoxal-phosphate dependent enzyme, partial [Acidimicrobiales bacterium]